MFQPLEPDTSSFSVHCAGVPTKVLIHPGPESQLDRSKKLELFSGGHVFSLKFRFMC